MHGYRKVMPKHVLLIENESGRWSAQQILRLISDMRYRTEALRNRSPTEIGNVIDPPERRSDTGRELCRIHLTLTCELREYELGNQAMIVVPVRTPKHGVAYALLELFKAEVTPLAVLFDDHGWTYLDRRPPGFLWALLRLRRNTFEIGIVLRQAEPFKKI